MYPKIWYPEPLGCIAEDVSPLLLFKYNVQGEKKNIIIPSSHPIPSLSIFPSHRHHHPMEILMEKTNHGNKQKSSLKNPHPREGRKQKKILMDNEPPWSHLKLCLSVDLPKCSRSPAPSGWCCRWSSPLYKHPGPSCWGRSTHGEPIDCGEEILFFCLPQFFVGNLKKKTLFFSRKLPKKKYAAKNSCWR